VFGRELQSSLLLPAPPLRTGVLASAAASLALATLGAVTAGTVFGFDSLYVAKAGIVCAVALAIAIHFVTPHHPFPRFGPANATTMARVALVALVAACLGEQERPAIAWSVAAATALIALLDGVDGWLARRSGLASAFGARFDMETDALLIMALAALTWRWQRAGAWVLACGLMRYAFVAAAGPWPWLDRPLPPSQRRKAICVVQVAGLAIVVTPIVTPPVSAWLALTTLVILSYSFAVDVWWLARRSRMRAR
jgi:phosphatidylglycerophosphate synthase